MYSGADTWHQNAADGQWFYGVFWAGMPDLNIRNPEVRAEIKRLATLWLARGADGFRLDAARHLVENGGGLSQVDQPETHAFWREFAAHVRSEKPEATLVGEAWTDTPIIATYYGSTATVPGGDELPMTFDFPLACGYRPGGQRGRCQRHLGEARRGSVRVPAGCQRCAVPHQPRHDPARDPAWRTTRPSSAMQPRSS